MLVITGIPGLSFGTVVCTCPQSGVSKADYFYLNDRGTYIAQTQRDIIHSMRPKLEILPNDEYDVQSVLPLFPPLKTYSGMVTFNKLVGYRRIDGNKRFDVWAVVMKLNGVRHKLFSCIEYSKGIVIHALDGNKKVSEIGENITYDISEGIVAGIAQWNAGNG